MYSRKERFKTNESEYESFDVMPPTDGESAHLFVIKKSEDVQFVIRSIVDISHNL